MYSRFLLFLIGFTLFFSCNNDDSNTGEILIRVENVSEMDFENVIVLGKEYGNISKMEYSEYFPFDMAYRYGPISLTSEGESFNLQPIDYVGESPLGPGFYTYQLDIIENMDYQFLYLLFVED